MQKITLFGMGILLLLVGCTVDCSDCCVCCNLNSPTPYNTYVVCDNQEIWDMRGQIRDFDCECDNTGCSRFPTQRVCNYGVWTKIDGQMVYEKGTITCTETIGKDRRCT